MRKSIISFLFIFIFSLGFSQIKNSNNGTKAKKDTTQANSIIKESNNSDSIKSVKIDINAYKWWSEDKPKVIFDTVLTIDKFYKNRMFNHKDYFGSMPFSNIGETFNPLLFSADYQENIDLLPFGKSNNLLRTEEVKYYDVKTPITTFELNNGYKEGQALNTTFSHSINSQFNYSFYYTGLRSLGKYNDQLSKTDNIMFTTNYHTKNQRYKMWSHYMVQNVDNEENAGISDLDNFNSGDSNFKSRNRIPVNLTGANSEFQRRRFHLGQEFGILRKDTLSKEYFLGVKNMFTYEGTHYSFNDKKNQNTYYNFDNLVGNTLSEQHNTKSLKKLSNTASVVVNWNDKLHFEAGLKYQNIRFYLDRLLTDYQGVYPSEITDNRIGFAGKLNFNWKEGVVLNSQAEFMTGDFFKSTYFIDNVLKIQPLKNYYIEANLGMKSMTPNLNLLLNQSYLKNFNYYLSNFNNEKTLQFGGKLHLKPYDTKITAQFFNIDNYTYIDSDYQSKQASSSTSIMQVGVENLFTYNKFHLKTQLAYQKVTSNANILPLPDFVGRATLYYQSKIFKGAAEIQTGINAYYFSKFKSREFFPVLNEFKLQDTSENYKIGSYPILDAFLHMKVKRMLIIFEAQHFNSSFTGYNFYSDPKTPFTDFRLNLGIIWYIFS